MKVPLCRQMMTRVTRTRLLTFIAFILILTAHRLPAPVRELPDTTPTPAATAATPEKPSPKIQAASKPTRPKPEVNAAPSRAARFAGTWMGTMQTFPAGNQSAVITIDPAQTTMIVDWFGKHTSANAQIEGDSLRAAFPPPGMQPETHKWTLTPQPDGVTARVRFQCFMNDFTAIFRRVGTDSGSAQTAKSTH